MSLELTDFEKGIRKAVSAFWRNRAKAKKAQSDSGGADMGERSSVTAGKNMDRFADVFADIVNANGLDSTTVLRERALLTLPGFFRPTKVWDILVLCKGELVAAIELKSHVGPSFGNNFNNRAEEAIGTAHDFWTAYREGAFGKQPPPFVGWFMLVEDAPKSQMPVKADSPHFDIFKDFEGTSYLVRYERLCEKLIREQLYTSAAVIASAKDAKHGAYSTLSPATGLTAFAARLAGHVAATAARLNDK